MDSSKALQDSLAGIKIQLAAIESQLESTRKQIDLSLDALETGHLKEGDPAPFSAGVTLTRINEAAGRMAAAESQSQILAAYLEEAQSMASRGILFLKEDERYSKWQSIGFDSIQVEPVPIQDRSSPIIRSVSDQQVVVRGEGLEKTFPWLRESAEPPRMSLCIPLVFGDTVPVVLYLDSTEEMPIDFLELLTHLVVLILKNQYLQQLPALESAQGGEAGTKAITAPEPLQLPRKEQDPATETMERPASMIAEEPSLRLAGTESEEETRSPEGAEDDGQPEPDILSQEETRADTEQPLILPEDTAPESREADPEPVVILQNVTSPKAAEPAQPLTESSSPEEASDLESAPETPGFTYKKPPPKDQALSSPSMDKDSD